jgi:rhodanese-related sulfurtransferase
MNSITVEELQKKMKLGEPLQLIDVRENYEREICTLQSEHIPLEQLMQQLERIRTDIPVIFHCRSGDRAKAAVATLSQKHGFENIYNLEGGIMAWADRIDATLEKY